MGKSEKKTSTIVSIVGLLVVSGIARSAIKAWQKKQK